MKIKTKSLIICIFITYKTLCYSQDYLGSYREAPPKAFLAHEALPPEAVKIHQEMLGAWEKTRLSIQIFTDKIIITAGNFKVSDAPMVTYAIDGKCLIAKTSDEPFFFPIYIYNHNTIFARGVKLIRVEDDKNSTQ